MNIKFNLLILIILLSLTLVGCSNKNNPLPQSPTDAQSTVTEPLSTQIDTSNVDNTQNNDTPTTKKPSTTRKTEPPLKNNPKLVKTEVIKNKIAKTNSLAIKPSISNLGLSAKSNVQTVSYNEYLEKGKVFALKLCIENPERDTIVDVLLNDSQEGENCLYSTSSSKFKIENTDTLWDKDKKIYYTYVIINVPACKSAGERSIQITEINFLRRLINQEIKGDVDLTQKSATNLGLMCMKDVAKIDVKSSSVTSNSVNIALNVTDPDKSISKINVYLYKNNSLVSKKENITDTSSVSFSSLDSITTYKLEIEYIYNRGDNKGNQIQKVTKEIRTALKGSGTKSDPYQISTIEEWKEMERINTEGKYFKLMNDIDANNTDISVFQKVANPFMGILDGNNKSINNLKITSAKKNYADDILATASLFHEIGKVGIVKNLNLNNFNIDIDILDGNLTEDIIIGGICAENYGEISNCNVNGIIKINCKEEIKSINFSSIDEIAGEKFNGCKINNCNASIKIIITTPTKKREYVFKPHETYYFY